MLLAQRRLERAAIGDDPRDPAPAGHPLERHPFGLWLVLYAVSGFCALALEILCFA